MTPHIYCSICYTICDVWPVIVFCSEVDEEFVKEIELDRVGRIQGKMPKENTRELANFFSREGLFAKAFTMAHLSRWRLMENELLN